MKKFGMFYLDNEKDMIVELYQQSDRLFYVLRTPNHKTGNLITNLAKLCDKEISYDENGLKIIRGEVPCYIDAGNNRIYIFRLGNTKVANIYPDGRIEMKASIPAISKTLMSQTKDYRLDVARTIIKTYILNDCKFHADLHTHMNANLSADLLMALGIKHQIRYPLYYIKKLNLRLADSQWKKINARREKISRLYENSDLAGKYLDRKIDDNTFINFADLILGNLKNASYNMDKIRASLTILKDGQAVFTNLEKVYLYRYVFTKGISYGRSIRTDRYERIPDNDIVDYLRKMYEDAEGIYKNNTLFQDKLLWIARTYQKQGIEYVEISDTTLVKEDAALDMLKQVHEIMPQIQRETGVTVRFLAALRRIPLTLVKDQITTGNYLLKNLNVLRAVSVDPYVSGCDIVGEEVNDIRELQPVITEIVKIARDTEGFVIRIHAGENDGLTDNVENSIHCIEQALTEGQKMPQVRIGHGLYTPNLNSVKGRKLLKYLKDNGVVLEFQITSNVRLNNLNRVDAHPLKKYLKAGINCVQGTDGAAIYGTNCIDEQLSLEKLLNLSHDDLLLMKEAESAVMKSNLNAFRIKQKTFTEMMKDSDLEALYEKRLAEGKEPEKLMPATKLSSYQVLKSRVKDMPWDRKPIIIAGGSFNNSRHVTRISRDGIDMLDRLLAELDKDKYFLVIGDSLSGYEKHVVDHNRGFEIFAIVPALISAVERDRLLRHDINLVISTETSSMGLYKSFNYEIFERRSSAVIAIDGNSACVNLIQEAKNGKGKATILVCQHSSSLKVKAKSLEGYVTLFDWNDDLAEIIERKLSQS